MFSEFTPIGEISLTPFSPTQHSSIIQAWLSLPYAKYWGMQDKDIAAVQSHYEDVLSKKLCQPYLGYVDGTPQFFIEVYDPEVEGVSKFYDKVDGDTGMHILIAPAEIRIKDFTYQVFMFVMEFLFSKESVERIVVEPDHRNQNIHTINKRAGFVHQEKISMGHKDAFLAFCTRAQFDAAKAREARFQSQGDKAHIDIYQKHQQSYVQHAPALASAAVDASTWAQVNRLLVRKAIAEFSHERILQPVKSADSAAAPWETFSLTSDDTQSTYTFNAQVMALDHWYIDLESLTKRGKHEEEPLDAVKFFLEFQERLGISQEMLPTYLEEITSTLSSSAFKHTKPSPSVDYLAEADFQEIEVAMMEGHPCFVANNGRIGFSSADFHAYAPEAGSPITLIWLAAHKRRATFSSIDGFDYEKHMTSELDITLRERFNAQLIEQQLAPEDYLLIPVHPWQWFNKLCSIYAPDVAAKDLVCLGYGDDAYLAQQSIRTFYNISQPGKSYVKTALSILNMGFMRGLSSYYMRTTPDINQWVFELVSNDPYLQANGFSVLREFAAIGYSNPYYENEQVGNSPYKKMLAALWRENPTTRITENQRLMTMASLLHVDPQGKALLPEIIKRSGLSIDAWLQRYLRVYFKPLLHCLYQHKLVFMPHGENLILTLENNIPVHAFMKDIGEEVCLLNSDISLPENVQRISITAPENEEVLAVFTDIFDCFFRFVAQILYQHANYAEDSFWRNVAACVHQYQDEHPQLTDRFTRHDLFAEDFALSCLNRLQLKNNKQMVNLADPSSSLQFAGNLENPIAKFKREEQPASAREVKEQAIHE